jgi:outer membrane cobalamin receptor
MRRSVLLVVCLLQAAFAADLHVKIVDPRSAAVAGAQVLVLRANESSPLQIRTTAGDGEAVFKLADDTATRIQVLAAGFAAESRDVSKIANEPLLIELKVSSPVETVVVSATRTPLASEQTSTSVDSLTGEQIGTMQPVAIPDALRFLPGTVISGNGQRGALTSLFVRGGDSTYNKVLIDGVPVNEPGGRYDFGTVPLAEAGRMEFLRGAESTLYGSDAMTSVVQVFSDNGTTRVPELRFGADGGNFGTAHGFAALSGARSWFDYDLFADQFNTNGQGPNADYSNSTQGGNLGAQLNPRVLFRLRMRHSNSRTGIPGAWDYNGDRILPPNTNERSRQNNFLASGELTIAGPGKWQHRVTGFEYHHKRLDTQDAITPGREPYDFLTQGYANLNRAGFDYQGDYAERNWTRTTVGFEFEDENGSVGDLFFPPLSHGLRLNYAAYLQQTLSWKRLSVVAGGRFVHNDTFGNRGVPRVALSFRALRGGDWFSGTRLRFSYATGIKAPTFDQSFSSGAGVIPNPNLKAEENRAFEAGFEQALLRNKYSFSAIYFNNQFRDQIDFAVLSFVPFTGQFQNIDKSMAHGAELQVQGQMTSRLSLNGAYVYTSSQILEQPSAFDPLHEPGQPLLRRPKHLGSLLVSYLGNKWGGSLGGSFVGRRSDSDFLGFTPPITHAAGYARVDISGWYAITSRITAYANVGNVLNQHYNEVVGYPALTANFRAGLKFRIGGD